MGKKKRKTWQEQACAAPRMTWDEMWMRIADTVALRSQCSRRKCGAVAVTADNRVISTGYNNPSRALNLQGQCNEWCPRAMQGDSSPDYSACLSIHAEINCIVFANGPDLQGATIYVSSSVCQDCATTIANAGIKRVVMRVQPEDAHRSPEAVVDFLEACSVAVAVIKTAPASTLWVSDSKVVYRQIFYQAYGFGPHLCHFCGGNMAFTEAIHHLDGDHDNNVPTNLVAAHDSCHKSHHTKGKKIGWANPEYLASRPKVTCPDCGMTTNPGPLGLHFKATGHGPKSST